jgi:MerR family transcriptional regulator/heat shock protein HspR
MNEFNPADDAAVYVISIAAEISGMHAQTLRQYDRLGLVSPDRAIGRGRRYSLRDIAMLREVQRLVNEGINLAGIKKILELEEINRTLNDEASNLRNQLAGAPQRRDLVPLHEANAFVIWRSER